MNAKISEGWFESMMLKSIEGCLQMLPAKRFHFLGFMISIKVDSAHYYCINI